MDEKIKTAIIKAAAEEVFPKELGIKLLDIDDGYSLVEMEYQPQTMNNLYQRAHGGALFALIDEAFETAGQTDGTIAVALNVNVTFVSSPKPNTKLKAEARRISMTKRTSSYDIRVSGDEDQTIAVCQALAYQTGKPIPFL